MDFVILKVNGHDVSRASQEDAVRIFQETSEPIVIEVLRRCMSPGDDGKSDGIKSRTSSVAVQTDLHGFEAFLSPSFGIDDRFWPGELGTPGDDQDLIETILDDEMYDVYDESMEYQEVLLKREASEDPFGLTLYYVRETQETSEEDEENVYIRDIIPNSLAAGNGQLRVGDQLLQVNGVSVHSQHQAEELFRHSGLAINLLIARPPRTSPPCQLTRSHTNEVLTGGVSDTDLAAEEGVDLRCPSHHDSGVGLAADDGNSSLPTTIDSGKSLAYQNDETLESSPAVKPLLSPSVKNMNLPNGETGTNSSKSSLGSRLSGRSSCGSEQPLLDVDQQLYMVHKKMDAIQIECEKLLRTSAPDFPEKASWGESDAEHIYESINESVITEPLYCSPYEPKKKTRLVKKDRVPEQCPVSRNRNCDRNLEVTHWLRSVQPTSTEVTCDLGEVLKAKSEKKRREPPRMTLDLGSNLMNSSLVLCPPSVRGERTPDTALCDQLSVVSCQTCRNCVQLPSPGGIPVFLANRSRKDNKIRNSARTQLVPHTHTMYTNAENLQQTILLQQKIFQEHLHKKKKKDGSPIDGDGVEMEWRIKRRPDGTRYISRRAVRTKTRGRARMEEENCFPMDYSPDAENKIHTRVRRDARIISDIAARDQRYRRHEKSSKCHHISELKIRHQEKTHANKMLEERHVGSLRPKHALADGILSVTTV